MAHFGRGVKGWPLLVKQGRFEELVNLFRRRVGKVARLKPLLQPARPQTDTQHHRSLGKPYCGNIRSLDIVYIRSNPMLPWPLR
jgi:hypothetical protein